MTNKTLTIVLVLLGLAAGGYFLTAQNPQLNEQASNGQLLFPDLEQRLNDITRIRVEHYGDVYDVTRTGEQWQLPGKGGYPVLFKRVKPLLLALTQLEKVEPKTGKPENYARLGVQEPAADTRNTRIKLYVTGDEPVASLIIGSIRGGLITGGRDGIYVRVSGDSRAWLVAGRLDLPDRQVDWVDRQIVHIKPKQVKRVTIRHPDNSQLVIEKPFQGASGFRIVSQSEDTGPGKASEVNVLARSLAGLKMEDMRSRPPTYPSEADAVTAMFETWDGLQVTVTTKEQDGQVWAWFDAGGDTTSITDDVKKKLEGWIYRLPASRASKLRVRFSDLSEED
jgi:hypothetical protein